jgi:NfeD-like C-terminal, partner-binding
VSLVIRSKRPCPKAWRATFRLEHTVGVYVTSGAAYLVARAIRTTRNTSAVAYMRVRLLHAIESVGSVTHQSLEPRSRRVSSTARGAAGASTQMERSICAARHGLLFEAGASSRWASFRSKSEALGRTFWNRTVRKRLQKSVEPLIGRTATVRSACRAHGQVYLDGYIWEARCAEGADRGETVAVVSRDLLWLVVERVDRRKDRPLPSSPLPATAGFPPPRFRRRVDRRGRRSLPSRQPALLLAPSQ